MANPANYEGYLAANGPTDEQRRKRIATLQGAKPLPTGAWNVAGGLGGLAESSGRDWKKVGSNVANASERVIDTVAYGSPQTQQTTATPLAVKPTASMPSIDNPLNAYRARMSQQPYKYGAGDTVLPTNEALSPFDLTRTAPLDRRSGVYSGGIDQPASAGVDPIAAANFRRQIEDRAIDQRLTGSNPNVGYVAKAYSNAPGAPKFDAANRGMGMFDTNDVVNAIDGTRYGKKIKAWDDAGIAAAKADPARAVAFKGDRRPVDTRDAKVFDANKAASERQASETAGRANQLAIAQEAKLGEIGKATTKSDSEMALEVQRGKNTVAANEARPAQEKDSIAGLAGKLVETLQNKAYVTKDHPALTEAEVKGNEAVDMAVNDIHAKMRGLSGTGKVGSKPIPAIGTISMGRKFKGGNPADPNAWEKV